MRYGQIWSIMRYWKISFWQMDIREVAASRWFFAEIL